MFFKKNKKMGVVAFAIKIYLVHNGHVSRLFSDKGV